MTTDASSLFTRFLVWIGLYQTLTCFYCNTVHIFSGSNKKSPHNWYCDICDSRNLTDEKGEIVDDVPQMHYTSMNTPIGSARVRDPPPKKEQAFCKDCVTNQNLVISLLGSYIPADNDPDFEYAMATFDTYRQRIEANYPIVCPKCEEKVSLELNQKNYQMKARVFGEALKTSKPHEIKQVLTMRFPNLLKWLLSTIFYLAVNMPTLVFLGFVVADPNLVDITATPVDPAMNSIVVDNVVLSELPFHQVIKVCLYSAWTTLEYLWENIIQKHQVDDSCAHLLVAWFFILSILTGVSSFYDPTMFKRMVNYKRQPINVELFKDYHMLLGITRVCLSIFYRFANPTPDAIQQWTAITLAFNVVVMLYTWVMVDTKDPIRVHLGSGIMGTPVGKKVTYGLPSEVDTIPPKFAIRKEERETSPPLNAGPEINGIASSLSLGTSTSVKRAPRNPFIIHRNRMESMRRREPKNEDSGSEGENEETTMDLESDHDNMDWEPSSKHHNRKRAKTTGNLKLGPNNEQDLDPTPIIHPPRFHLREPDTGLEDLLASSLRITESHPLVQTLKEFDRKVTRQGNLVKGMLLVVSGTFLLVYTHKLWQFFYASMCVFTCMKMRSYYSYLKGSADRAANNARIDMSASKRRRAMRFSKFILLLVHLRVYLFLFQIAIILMQSLGTNPTQSLELTLSQFLETMAHTDLLTIPIPIPVSIPLPELFSSIPIDYFKGNEFPSFCNFLFTHPLDTVLAFTILAFPTLSH